MEKAHIPDSRLDAFARQVNVWIVHFKLCLRTASTHTFRSGRFHKHLVNRSPFWYRYAFCGYMLVLPGCSALLLTGGYAFSCGYVYCVQRTEFYRSKIIYISWWSGALCVYAHSTSKRIVNKVSSRRYKLLYCFLNNANPYGDKEQQFIFDSTLYSWCISKLCLWYFYPDNVYLRLFVSYYSRIQSRKTWRCGNIPDSKPWGQDTHPCLHAFLHAHVIKLRHN